MKRMAVILLLLISISLIGIGCATIGTPVPPRVFDPVTMVPGEWPY